MGRGVSFPTGVGAPPLKIFDSLMSKWRIFGECLMLNFVLFITKNSKKNTPGMHGLHAIESDGDRLGRNVYRYLLLHRRSQKLGSGG